MRTQFPKGERAGGCILCFCRKRSTILSSVSVSILVGDICHFGKKFNLFYHFLILAVEKVGVCYSPGELQILGYITLNYILGAKMPCPFLSRLSQNFVKNYAPVLLKTYGSQCPVMSRSINHMTQNNEVKGTLHTYICLLHLKITFL